MQYNGSMNATVLQSQAKVTGMNGAVVQARRVALKLSRQQLADACGVAMTTIYRIEMGTHPNASVDTLCRIARVLQVPPCDLLLPDCGAAA